MAKIGRKPTDYELLEGGAGGGRGVGSGGGEGGGTISRIFPRQTGSRSARDYKENAKDATTKEVSGEMRFREPRQRTENEYITDYGRTPRMSDDMKKGGAVKKMAAGGSVSRRADGIAKRGKTRGKVC
jgi:hypothetical protein